MIGDYEGVCCKAGCHGRTCLPLAVYERALETHEDFYCSAGHPQHFIARTEKEGTIRKLRDRVNVLERRVIWRDEEIGELKAERWECRWSDCEFRGSSLAGLRNHMRARHGMPSLALVRSEAS